MNTIFNVNQILEEQSINFFKNIDKELEAYSKQHPGKNIFYTQPEMRHDPKTDSWGWHYEIGIVPEDMELSKDEICETMGKILKKPFVVINLVDKKL